MLHSKNLNIDIYGERLYNQLFMFVIDWERLLMRYPKYI